MQNDENLKLESKDYLEYFERQWLQKIETTNLFNFHRLSRIRNTNPAEAFHSATKRQKKLIIHK